MRESAGLLPYRKSENGVEVFLTHPGGPFNARKNAWSITKGEVLENETHESAMRREFIEETGLEPTTDLLIDLGISKSSGKANHVWAAESDLDVSKFHCDSMVELEWPPKSGLTISFPENDRAAWFDIRKAGGKVYKNQIVFIERLAAELEIDLSAAPVDQAADTDNKPQTTLDL